MRNHPFNLSDRKLAYLERIAHLVPTLTDDLPTPGKITDWSANIEYPATAKLSVTNGWHDNQGDIMDHIDTDAPPMVANIEYRIAHETHDDEVFTVGSSKLCQHLELYDDMTLMDVTLGGECAPMLATGTDTFLRERFEDYGNTKSNEEDTDTDTSDNPEDRTPKEEFIHQMKGVVYNHTDVPKKEAVTCVKSFLKQLDDTIDYEHALEEKTQDINVIRFARKW